MQPEAELLLKKKQPLVRKWIKLLFKLAVTTLCFWYIATKIDFQSPGGFVAGEQVVFIAGCFVSYVFKIAGCFPVKHQLQKFQYLFI